MSVHLRAMARLLADVMHRVSFGVTLVFAVLALGALLGSVLGLWPWLGLALTWGGAEIAYAGILVQVALALFGLILAFHLPTNARMMALELSHRRFDIAMQDIARAYHIAHAADRSQAFRLTSEFDAVKERLAFLRRHPDLDALEPELLDLAAKMSFAARDLAEVYADDKVDRARMFLRQRQEEVHRFTQRLGDARAAVSDLKVYKHEVEIEEAHARRALDKFRAELIDLVPEVFAPPQPDPGPQAGTVTKMRRATHALHEPARPAE